MNVDNSKLILAIDQGTSGTMASLYNQIGERIAYTDVSVKSVFPNPGWVEQDPFELLSSIKISVNELLSRENLKPGQIDSFGLANQGECLLLWDIKTGKPVYNMIGWQCVRSAETCYQLRKDGLEQSLKDKTGLPLNPEWPATKIPWAIKNIPEVSNLLRAGRLAFSQSDSWFIYHLTKERMLLTDHSTASRSGFYNLQTQSWDQELIEMFQGENLIFPKIINCSDNFGEVDFGNGWIIPWRGNALDQPAALLGQACIHPGEAKVTYGTCAGFWYNMGNSLIPSKNMDTSVAWQIKDQPTYAIAGEAISAGAPIIWLREKLKFGWTNSELSDVAKSAEGQDDLVFIPAFNGLGAPFWIPKARGTIFGITAGTYPNHLVRAGLESVAFSVRDLLEAFSSLDGYDLPNEIKTDGGMTTNDYLMQFQADILGKPILVPQNNEGTSTGVAILAGISSGFFPDISILEDIWKPKRIYTPKMSIDERERRYQQWKNAIEHTIEMYEHNSDNK